MLGKRQEEPEAQLVRLHLRNDEPSFEGILMDDLAGHYRLMNVSLFQDEGEAVKLEGESWIPRERVLFVQVIG